MRQLPKHDANPYPASAEIQEIYDLLTKEHAEYLAPYGVSMPTRDSIKALWLVFLRKYQGILVHKDKISDFVSSVMPHSGKDQQVRHLGAGGWYVLNKGEKIQNEEERVPVGYHVLITSESPKPSFLYKALKRAGRVSARNFDQLKAVYGFRCATCGSVEGKPHLFDPSVRTELQKAHMEPSKELTLENTIPQCQLCNQAYLDDFRFDEKGRTVAVASMRPVRAASTEVRQMIYEELDREFGK
jgi:hypothetical protein